MRPYDVSDTEQFIGMESDALAMPGDYVARRVTPEQTENET